MKEKNVERLLMLQSQQLGFTLFKNEVGMAYARDGRPIRYGLCKGSSDLIGWRSIEITPDMVGKHIAQFCAVEVKKDKKGSYKATDEQKKFIDVVNKAGGFGVVADNLGDLK
jgi:hypothetical protein